MGTHPSFESFAIWVRSSSLLILRDSISTNNPKNQDENFLFPKLRTKPRNSNFETFISL